MINLIYAVLLCLIIFTSCTSKTPTPSPEPLSERELHEVSWEGLSTNALSNGTYQSQWTGSGLVTLQNGEWSEQAAPGSAIQTSIQLTDRIAYGHLNDAPSAAVILVTTPGGSGTFYDLAVVIDRDRKPFNRATVNLGDRVDVHSVSIDKNEVVVDITTHGSGDALCCPTLRMFQRFALEGGKLIIVAPEDGDAPVQSLAGAVWKWRQTLYNNDTKSIPSHPENYTLQLTPDGRVTILADCNRGGGRYRLNKNQISIEITHTTMAACPEGSFQDEFIRDLNGVAIYFFEGNNLYLDLKYDSGTMKFSD